MDYEEEMMIRTEHLSKSYGEKEAVCDLTLDVYKRQGVMMTPAMSIPIKFSNICFSFSRLYSVLFR